MQIGGNRHVINVWSRIGIENFPTGCFDLSADVEFAWHVCGIPIAG
jgi:hypothetical protein